MGVIIRGNNIEFEGNTYRVVEQCSYTKFEMVTAESLSVGETIGELSSAVSSLSLVLNLANVLLINTLSPQEQFEMFDIQNININNFSFENGCVCWSTSGGMSRVSVGNLADCSSISFSVENNELLININFVAEGTPITTEINNIGTFTAKGICGIWGLLKYGEKYAVIQAYSDIKWAEKYPLTKTSATTNPRGTVLVPSKQTVAENPKSSPLFSQENISQLYQAEAQTLGYLLWNFGFNYQSSYETRVYGATSSDISFDKALLKKDIEL